MVRRTKTLDTRIGETRGRVSTSFGATYTLELQNTTWVCNEGKVKKIYLVTYLFGKFLLSYHHSNEYGRENRLGSY